MTLLKPADLVGTTIVAVTMSWTVFDGERCGDPLHFWLHLEPDVGPVKFHTLGGIEMTAEAPYDSHTFSADDRIVVEPVRSDHVLATLLGRRVQDASTLVAADDDQWENGLVLHLDDETALAIVDDVDELRVYPWPSPTVAAWGYVERRR